MFSFGRRLLPGFAQRWLTEVPRGANGERLGLVGPIGLIWVCFTARTYFQGDGSQKGVEIGFVLGLFLD